LRAIFTIAAVCVAGLAACGGNAVPPAPAVAPAPASPGAPDLADFAVGSDTIAIGEYIQFVHPLRKLGVQPLDSDDFGPYDTEEQPDSFSFRVPGEWYLVGPFGAGHRLVSDLGSMLFLPVEPGLFIERLAFTRVDGDPVFVIQATDNEAGVGIVVRLDSLNLTRRWRADIPGFNVGFALRDGHHLYVSCIGFVGKLDLNSGRYVWRHDDLYATEQFNNFDRPRINGDAVEFPAGDRTFRVDRKTGRRLTP
jgi:hypothetical protein